MIENYKIVVVCPAGRKRYMEVALPYILRERGVIDEYRIWVNTDDLSDISYFKELQTKYPDFITLDARDRSNLDSNKIYAFFSNCIDESSIYIRVDDDVIWYEENFFQKLAKNRIDNPSSLIIYPSIINNAIFDFIFQEKGAYSNASKFGYSCMDSHGWDNPQVAELKHREFLSRLSKSDLSVYKFDKIIFNDFERVSVNCICWFGKDFKKFNGLVGTDEEPWISCDKPKELKIPNSAIGNTLCVHYSFFTQRDHLDRTNILQEYRDLSLLV